MQRLQDGNVNGAWSDLLAVHRFARLASCGPTLIDRLVAVTTDGIACATDRALLQHAQLTADRAAKMRADLDALPPMAKMIDALDAGERLTALDTIIMIARGKIRWTGWTAPPRLPRRPPPSIGMRSCA